MPALSDLYEQPTVLSASSGHLRIYAQIAYKAVRHARMVPVVIAEAMVLARYFPLCWRDGPEGPELIALRSLLPDGEGQPGDSRNREIALPLALQAFPMVVPDSNAIERQQLYFDRTIADAPTDIGAPILLPTGKLSRAALMRAKIAVSVARAFPETMALSRELHAAGLLDPWPLAFDLGHGETVEIGGLSVLAPGRLDDGALYDLVAAFGPQVGLFVSLHRTSLFRAGVLLAAARHAVAKRRSAREKMPPATLDIGSLPT